MDRRAVFFFVAAGACLLMVPVGVEKYQGVAIGTAIAYVVFGIASFLDYRGRSR